MADPAERQAKGSSAPVAHRLDAARIRSTCQITSEPHLGAAVYFVRGQLDSTTAGAALGALAGAIGQPAVLIDLSGVTFMDGDGVAVIREVIHATHDQGGRVAIARPWRVATPVLTLVGMAGFVYLAQSAAGAVSWLSDSNNLTTHRDDRELAVVHTAAG
jgi:anti-anti-sigma factor